MIRLCRQSHRLRGDGMNVILAHASISENGSVNGVKGDQTKREVCTRKWYSKPWGSVIRFEDAVMADKVAECMEKAAANDLIGYSQNTRNTLLIEARKYGYDVSKVKVPVNTDCSALVSVACMYAGVDENVLYKNGNSATTRNLQAALKSTGFVKVYTSAAYTNKPDKLKRGDILLKSGSHVAVVVSIDDFPKLTEKVLKKGMKGESVKWLQMKLNKQGYKLKVDGDFGKLTATAVIDFQQKHGLVVDGICGQLTINALNGV